jgi:hypothetical protein
LASGEKTAGSLSRARVSVMGSRTAAVTARFHSGT